MHAARREVLRILRFGGVGIVATLTYVVVTTALIELLAASIMTATVIGNLTAILVSYFGHLHVTFQVPPYHRIFLPRFLFTAAVGMLINVGIAWLFSVVFAIPYQAIIAIVLVALPLASYLVSRYWIYFPALDERSPVAGRSSQTDYE